VEISAIGFADQWGRSSLAGPLLACYAAGSAAGGLVYGAVHWSWSLTRRLVVAAAAMSLTVALLPLAAHPAVLGPLLFLAGLGIAPTMISGMSIVERVVPPGQLTEGLTWSTTGIVVGLSATSPIAGRVVDDIGARHGFLVGLASGVTAILVCALGLRNLARAEAPPVGEPVAEEPAR
jgi:MFS family permease